uniref:Gypsy retrotransposon integrase-like protein 1 n=1 Tax=Astyanax mexicanus TaxID=7994 RepID=A0A3B1JYN6_ASTMX
MGQPGTEDHSRPTTKKAGKPHTQRASLKCAQTRQPCFIPKGLIGTKCTAQVKIGKIQTNCLLDTGSQVTTISQSFFNQQLPAHQMNPLGDLLEVEGANGQTVPYLGYVDLSITFPEEFAGAEVEVPTLALVVPDLNSDTQPQVLIGTNTLDVLYMTINEKNVREYNSSSYGYKAVLKILKARLEQQQNLTHGLVKLHSKNSQVIAAGEDVVLEGCISVKQQMFGTMAVLEHPTCSTLPGGLLVKPCLMSIPSRSYQKVPVMLKNESGHDIVMPQKCIIAELNAVQALLPQPSRSAESESVSPELSFNFEGSPISTEWKERVTQKLSSLPEVFAHNDLDYGRTNRVKHHIKLSDETPFKHRARPIHPQDLEAVRKHLQELLQAGIIRESESPFSSPIVVVRKKNGDVRLCIDYRKLNLQTVKDAYALPNLEETFSTLTGSKWFSVLDLKSGYYQIEVEETDKPKTAFVCPLGFWEFNRMPQGITNAPSTFQRLMEKCMSGMNLKEVLVFLDDLIVFSKTLEEHEVRLLKVLNRLKEYGLKLSPTKCKFFQTSVRYLGHIVSQDGVETDPNKVEALKTWPRPKGLKELRSFLGFSGYYRRFIKNYSSVVRPLTNLTVGYPPLRRSSQLKKEPKQYHDPKQPFGSRWTPECECSFQAIIEKLTSAPVLGFANPQLPYVLHTDASTTGLGAALYQEQEGKMRVISYASRGLSRSESKYPAHKLEFLALKWAVTEKFNDYLYGSPFTVVTDSNPLTYILTTAKMDATSYRWLATLSTFNFKLKYRAGKQNGDADGLSRRPHGELTNDAVSRKEQERIQQFANTHLEGSDVCVSQDVVKAICEKHFVRHTLDECQQDNDMVAHIHSLVVSSGSIPDGFVDEEQSGLPVIPQMSEEEIQNQQRADPCLREIIHQMETGETISPAVREELPQVTHFLKQWKKLRLYNKILYRQRLDGDNPTYQLVLPEPSRAVVLKSLHDDMGHMGMERTLNLARSRFYWPKMSDDVERKIKTCDRCVRRKTLPERAAPLMNITSTRPLELVCMDFLSIEPDQSNTKDVLVITDHFTKYAVAIPTPNQKAQTVAKCLWENFIVHYGIPECLHSDQGPDFESHVIKELCQIMGIRKSRTTPYHPRGNPVERFNRTLLNLLGVLSEEDKSKWKQFVKPLVHAYNCTKNDVTGHTPYELMFGRQPKLPVDLAFGLPLRDKRYKSHSQYVQDLKSRLDESFKLAQQSAEKIAKANKTRFDRHVTASKLEVGDRVLVRAVRLRGKHKLADKWEPDIHIVVKQAENFPVYTVKPETTDGPLRTLHRDLLLPCNFLPDAAAEPPVPKPQQKPRTRQSVEQEPVDQDSSTQMEAERETEDVLPGAEQSESSEDTDSGESDCVRRSNRKREQPERLHYAQFGNPVVSMVQSLFHGLSTAFTEALRDIPEPDYLPCSHSKPVTAQPYRCTGTCIRSSGEGVTQVIKV